MLCIDVSASHFLAHFVLEKHKIPFCPPQATHYQADMVNTAGQQSMNTLRMHVKCIMGNYGW